MPEFCVRILRGQNEDDESYARLDVIVEEPTAKDAVLRASKALVNTEGGIEAHVFALQECARFKVLRDTQLTELQW